MSKKPVHKTEKFHPPLPHKKNCESGNSNTTLEVIADTDAH